MIRHLLILVLTIPLLNCSNDIEILGKRVELQAKKNNEQISSLEIKKIAETILK